MAASTNIPGHAVVVRLEDVAMRPEWVRYQLAMRGLIYVTPESAPLCREQF